MAARLSSETFLLFNEKEGENKDDLLFAKITEVVAEDEGEEMLSSTYRLLLSQLPFIGRGKKKSPSTRKLST